MFWKHERLGTGVWRLYSFLMLVLCTADFIWNSLTLQWPWGLNSSYCLGWTFTFIVLVNAFMIIQSTEASIARFLKMCIQVEVLKSLSFEQTSTWISRFCTSDDSKSFFCRLCIYLLQDMLLSKIIPYLIRILWRVWVLQMWNTDLTSSPAWLNLGSIF